MTNALHVNATVNCPHGGLATLIPADPRVSVSGQVIGTLAGQWTIAGCTFNVSGAPSPCVRIQWFMPAARVKVGGSPVVTQVSQGACLNAAQVPQGPPVVTITQPRMKGI